MGKRDEDRRKRVYVVGIILVLLTVLWTIGISYILASVIGLFLGQTVTKMMGFYVLIIISLLASIFGKSE